MVDGIDLTEDENTKGHGEPNSISLLKFNPEKKKKATDPDREGEGIAHEITQLLKLDPSQYQRLLFYEITPRNIKEALANPLPLDKNLIEAQISRQVLDRMIGFCLSPILQKKLRALSAGRVQSVVLKLIIERELAIKSHAKKKEYIICGICPINEKKITLKQVNSLSELIIYPEKSQAEEVVKKLSLNFQLLAKKEEVKFVLPKAPFTTSLLLSEAKSQLGFSIDQTTRLAQKLYEGIWLKNEKKPDAHEAIHPTYLNYQPSRLESSLSNEEYKLYELIFRHTLTSLMSPAKVNKITYLFDNNNYFFATTERISQFPGFLACAPEIYLPNYNIKLASELAGINQLLAQKIEVQEYQENKPVRYNEGTLVQTLEKLGIGRPSTYNTFGRILIKREYAALNEKGHFVPTEKGFLVNQ
ncbi:630_t:CDS:2 [Entrophospora sp. SA101]|nr:630_t:CDS:2 [Entrophospora sp. SA101]CAJ0918307.1 21737_t:CDS:2 [Entrophospora sp. SA101]